MKKLLNPNTVAAPVGPYSQASLTPGGGQWLHIAGQIGIHPDGRLAEGIDAQTEAVWTNIERILASAGMGMHDLVKINSYLVNAQHVSSFGAIRTRFLGDARPASTLLIVAALAKPEWLVEVEAIAWKP